ncbi:hypothetical protein TNCV_4302681 [Trichonephila clavipes]|nr:hypothetical protein TNCV_4302681 [Trichonephila clavipes]
MMAPFGCCRLTFQYKNSLEVAAPLKKSTEPILSLRYQEGSATYGIRTTRTILSGTLHYSTNLPIFEWMATRGLLATDHVILSHSQVTWTTPELGPPSPNYHKASTEGHLSSRQIKRASLPYTAGL